MGQCTELCLLLLWLVKKAVKWFKKKLHLISQSTHSACAFLESLIKDKIKRLCLEILCKGILRQQSAFYVEILGLCTTMYVSILLYKYFVVSHFANCNFCATLTH